MTSGLEAHIRLEPGAERHKTAAGERLSVRVPQELLDAVDDLVEDDVYANRSEAIRHGTIKIVQERGRDE